MKKSSITWHYRSSDPEWGWVFNCVMDLILVSDYIPHSLLVNSNAANAKICSRIIWRVNDP